MSSCAVMALAVAFGANAQEVAPNPPPVGAPAAQAAPSLTDQQRAIFVAIGHHLTDAAGAYVGYVRRASVIRPGFDGPASVQQALRQGSDYQPEQLQEGMVAFAALLALRDQAFVDGVRAQGDPDFANRLVNSPGAVLEVPGAREAAADVAGALRGHGEALQSEGKTLTQAAYDVQAHAWSKAFVANPHEVLAKVEASASQARTADEPTEAMLLQSVDSTPRTPAADQAAPSAAVVRGLAVAALAVLGRTGDSQDGPIEMLLHDVNSANCLKMAMLNLDQCLAAAGPHYEDVFCTGQHAVGETAKCISSAAEAGGEAPSTYPERRAPRRSGYEQVAAYGYGPAPAEERPEMHDAPPPPAYGPPRRDAFGPPGEAEESAPPGAYQPEGGYGAYGPRWGEDPYYSGRPYASGQ
ncbi:MAG TPA: hypothetical protein VHZ26_01145 [Caulobacteraceae bacterium]|nr:hypothetical protein [Caulobacteraceae bacterium]